MMLFNANLTALLIIVLLSELIFHLGENSLGRCHGESWIDLETVDVLLDITIDFGLGYE